MEWPPPDLVTYIDGLRKFIDGDRKYYAEFRTYLCTSEIELWGVVGDMLKARARYYRGEIARAKQDIQRFALGEDPQKPNRFGVMVCNWATRYLSELPKTLESLHESEKMVKKSPKDALHTEIYRQLHEIDYQLVDIKKQQIMEVTKNLERITYE